VSEQPIYVVTAGQYSDYHICGVFSTEEQAEAFRQQHAKANPRYDARIELYHLDAPEMDKEGVQLYVVHVDADGKITEMHTEGSEYRELGGAYAWGLPGEEQAVASSSRGFDVAAKIARDELAALKAREAGI
jgi:hypothetical protein